MKPPTLAIITGILFLVTGLAHGQTTTGFPPLPPIPKTGQLPDKPGATQFTFIVAGDNRPNGKTSKQPKMLSRILQDAQRFNPTFYLWCGDTISGHTADGPTLKKQYHVFKTTAAKAKRPVFNAPGNHEMDLVVTDPVAKTTVEMPNTKLIEFYLKYMRPKHARKHAYGAFSYGNSRFISMSTEEVAPPFVARSEGRVVASGLKLDPGYVSQEQIVKLKEDLEANKDKDHIFVFMHHPIKPNKAASRLDAATADNLEKIFAGNSKVSYVLAAHEHVYYNANTNTLTPPEWKKGSSPIYLVTGGAGAPLDSCGDNTGYCGAFYHYLVFNVDGDKVKVQVIALPEKLKKPQTKKRSKQ